MRHAPLFPMLFLMLCLGMLFMTVHVYRTWPMGPQRHMVHHVAPLQPEDLVGLPGAVKFGPRA